MDIVHFDMHLDFIIVVIDFIATTEYRVGNYFTHLGRKLFENQK